MDYRQRSLLQRMDQLVAWMGFELAMRDEKPVRRFKWWPMVLLLAGIIALVSEAVVPSWPTIGLYSLLGIQLLSGPMVMLGPMRQKDVLRESMDEREESWRARSNLIAYAAAGLVAWIGIAILGGVAVWSGLEGWKIPFYHSPLFTMGIWLISLCQYVLIVFILVPTLHASWSRPEIIEDEPEDRLSFVKLRP